MTQQEGTKDWLRLLEEHEGLDEVADRAFYVAHMLAEEGVEGAEALLEACMLAERHGYRFSDCTSMSRKRAPLALGEAAPAPS